MTLLPTAHVDFRAVLARHVRDLTATQPGRETAAWFFLRYLRHLQRRAEQSTSARACAGTMRGLLRFYVDRIETGSDLAWRFEEVQEAYRRALRHEQLS